LIAKLLTYFLLLAALAALVWWIPVLWEVAFAGAIGAAYWVFFRESPERNL